jgi:hypothetical protein
MPVRPIEWVPFGPITRYPHMAKHDARIWERFVARYAGYFTDAAYDVALGGSETTDPLATDAERLMWRFNTAKRIDAVVRNANEIWLCEVRRGSGTDAIGCVIVYGELSELDRWYDRPLVLTLVTDRIDPDLRLVAERLEIQVVELPEPDIGDPRPRGT